jgi:phosphoribosylformimino-5-aminoimidazole carboxamide ribotide isomerase
MGGVRRKRLAAVEGSDGIRKGAAAGNDEQRVPSSRTRERVADGRERPRHAAEPAPHFHHREPAGHRAPAAGKLGIMDIIPVLDMAQGVAVWAKAGDRARYEPVASALAPDAVGDAVALIRAFRRRLGARSCYVADLDAIQGGAIQGAMIRELARLETGFAGTIMVDAGASIPESGFEVLACGASQVVVGLETLRAFTDLVEIVRAVGVERVLFSLDLRMGRPILHPAMHDAGGSRSDAVRLTTQALEAGVRSVVLLDLARVGTGCGADLGLIEGVRKRFPTARLLAGGGVLGRPDLDRLRDAGCDGALVASAIHSGNITAADLADFAAPRVLQSPSVSR